MNTPAPDSLIAHTQNWILNVVVGLNFCPFAAREVKRGSIRYEVVNGDKKAVLEALSAALERMDADREVETMFLILPEGFGRFMEYLKLADAAEKWLAKAGYEGIYQVASFHPDYLFAGSRADDAANYTNRSPYPMLHLLREESVSRAVDSVPDPEAIPERNIALAREKGLAYMKQLLQTCRE